MRFENPHWNLPTIFWSGCSDQDLLVGCWVGMGLAMFALAGVFRRTCLLLLGVLYLSYVLIGGRFYFFQWDNLQLETTLHALLLPAYSMCLFRRRSDRLARRRRRQPHVVAVFLMHWLLFRLYFESGLAKVLTPGGGWCDLTAMDAYYNTAPLPTWIGWYAHNLAGWVLPLWWHKVETVLTLVIELILPMFIFAGRRVRTVLFVIFTAFQIAILLTANYGMFNYLSLILGLFLLDDAHYEPFFRLARRVRNWRRPVNTASAATGVPPAFPSVSGYLVRSCVLSVVAVVIVAASLVEMSNLFMRPSVRSPFNEWSSRRPDNRDAATLTGWPRRFARANDLAGDFCYLYRHCRLINSYHLFANMTRVRLVPQIQGQDKDGNWRDYRYRYAPGDLAHAPPLLAPFHPRLDFQVWFVGLTQPRRMMLAHPFFSRLVARLIEDPHCADQYFTSDPFPDSDPIRLRVVAYRYRMADPKHFTDTGEYWLRDSAQTVMAPRPVRHKSIKNRVSPAARD